MKLKDLHDYWQAKSESGDALAKVTALAIKEAILLRSPAKAFQIQDARNKTDMTLMSTRLPTIPSGVEHVGLDCR